MSRCSSSFSLSMLLLHGVVDAVPRSNAVVLLLQISLSMPMRAASRVEDRRFLRDPHVQSFIFAHIRLIRDPSYTRAPDVSAWRRLNNGNDTSAASPVVTALTVPSSERMVCGEPASHARLASSTSKMVAFAGYMPRRNAGVGIIGIITLLDFINALFSLLRAARAKIR